jgi:hypothetical protein
MQEVTIDGPDIRIRERISRSDGSRTIISVDARFDGNDHAVTGSPIVDTIIYQRSAPNRITATGKKAGVITLTETISTGPDGQGMTLIYVVYRGTHPVATGTAVFERWDV